MCGLVPWCLFRFVLFCVLFVRFVCIFCLFVYRESIILWVASWQKTGKLKFRHIKVPTIRPLNRLWGSYGGWVFQGEGCLWGTLRTLEVNSQPIRSRRYKPHLNGWFSVKPLWVFPKIGVPQNGWFIMENRIKMDDLGVRLFSETSLYWNNNSFYGKQSSKKCGQKRLPGYLIC